MGGTTYPMQDTDGMEVFQSIQNLLGEGLRDFLVELAIFPQTAPDRTTRDVLEEAASAISHNSKRNTTKNEITHMLRNVGVSSKPRYCTMCG